MNTQKSTLHNIRCTSEPQQRCDGVHLAVLLLFVVETYKSSLFLNVVSKLSFIWMNVCLQNREGGTCLDDCIFLLKALSKFPNFLFPFFNPCSRCRRPEYSIESPLHGISLQYSKLHYNSGDINCINFFKFNSKFSSIIYKFLSDDDATKALQIDECSPWCC